MNTWRTLQAAKRLNARQAIWALFFTRFHISITYRPGSRNTKPDVLSRQFAPKTNEDEREKPVLPPTCILSVLTWEVEKVVRDAQRLDPDPGTGPRGKLYVPAAAHTTKFACHPGKNRTISFLQRLFCWPSLILDVQEYVAAYPVCATRPPTHLPLAFCDRCPLLEGCGHTLPWISSLACLPLQVTPPF